MVCRSGLLFRTGLGLAALAAWLVASCALAVPSTVPYVGLITYGDTGAPLNGSVAVTASLHDAADASGAIWGPHSLGVVPVQDGVLSFVLGGQGALSLDSALLSSEVWLQVSVDGEVMSPRQRIHAVPYALVAADASQLGGVPATNYAQTGSLAAVALSGDVADLTGSFGTSPLGDAFVQVSGDTMAGDLDLDLNRLLHARMQVAASPPVACDSGTVGLFYFDSSTSSLEICDGSVWVEVGGTSSGGEGGEGGGGDPPVGESQTFTFSGGLQTFTVPAGVTNITIEAWGAQGGSNVSPSTGGLGGYATGDLAVTPGQVINVYVGGQGSNSGTTAVGGFNGGGGHLGSNGNTNGGGGASDVRVGGTTFGDRVIVAGGGGGSAWSYANTGVGGDGGGLIGGNGGFNSNATQSYGRGGTSSQGGDAGTFQGTSSPGVFGAGGTATNTNSGSGGAGAGGGGWYGGGGAAHGGGGGGGSSYVGGVTSGTTTAGQREGDGEIVISW